MIHIVIGILIVDHLAAAVGLASTALPQILVGPAMLDGHFGVHRGELFDDGVRSRPGGLEADLVAAVVIVCVIRIPLGIPRISTGTPIVPCGRAVLHEVFDGCFPKLQKLVFAVVQRCFLNLFRCQSGIMAKEGSGTVETLCQRRERYGIHLFLAVISDAWVHRCEIQIDSSVGTASAFDIQARRHGCDLIEVDRTDSGSFCLGAVIVANSRKDLL